MMKRRFSHPLMPGMTAGLIAPASPVFERDRREAAVRLLEEMGFHVVRGESVDAQDWCLSGTDQVRARDFERMFLDGRVDGVICLRGGWGAQHLLPLVDWRAVARHPKPFVGFSDITFLHAALAEKCGFITFHGPMPGQMDPVGLREERARQQWLRVLAGQQRRMCNPDGSAIFGMGEKSVAGRLIGGNLSVLCGLLDTPWEPRWDGALLLLEDVNERADRLEGMLMQLSERGVFRRIAGLVMGDFSRYEGMTSPCRLPFGHMARAYLPPDLPLLYGLHAGHGRDRMTLALNARYQLNPKKATLTLIEDIFR